WPNLRLEGPAISRGGQVGADGPRVVSGRRQHGKRSGHAVWGDPGWDRAQQFPDEPVQFCVSDEMGGLLAAQGSAQNARQAYHRFASASQTMGSVVLTDHFTLNAKHCSLQSDKTDVLPGELFSHVLALSPEGREEIEVKWVRDGEKVAALVLGCG